MAKANECYAYFRLDGSFDPGEITKELGIEPTKVSVEGEFISGSEIPQKTSRWMLYSRLPRSADLEQHIADVLDQLDVHREAIRKISKERGGFLELVGYFHAYYPGLVLPSDLVERLAGYTLTLDFDFYFYGSNE